METNAVCGSNSPCQIPAILKAGAHPITGSSAGLLKALIIVLD